MSSAKKILTLSNLLSFSRLILAVPILYALSHFDNIFYRNVSVLLCLFAAITDYLDGHFARKRNEITELGKVLDPLADKILVAIIAIKLFSTGELSFYYFFILILRDIILFVGGLLLSIKIKKVLPSNLLGKITVTIIGLVLLLVIAGFEKSSSIFLSIYYLSIVLIYGSLAGYIIRAFEFIKKQKVYEHSQSA